MDENEVGTAPVAVPGPRTFVVPPTRLLGSAAETVDRVVAAYDRAVAEGVPVVVLLAGPSGHGKTRIVQEVHRRLLGRDVASADVLAGSEEQAWYQDRKRVTDAYRESDPVVWLAAQCTRLGSGERLPAAFGQLRQQVERVVEKDLLTKDLAVKGAKFALSFAGPLVDGVEALQAAAAIYSSSPVVDAVSTGADAVLLGKDAVGLVRDSPAASAAAESEREVRAFGERFDLLLTRRRAVVVLDDAQDVDDESLTALTRALVKDVDARGNRVHGARALLERVRSRDVVPGAFRKRPVLVLLTAWEHAVLGAGGGGLGAWLDGMRMLLDSDDRVVVLRSPDDFGPLTHSDGRALLLDDLPENCLEGAQADRAVRALAGDAAVVNPKVLRLAAARLRRRLRTHAADRESVVSAWLDGLRPSADAEAHAWYAELGAAQRTVQAAALLGDRFDPAAAARAAAPAGARPAEGMRLLAHAAELGFLLPSVDESGAWAFAPDCRPVALAEAGDAGEGFRARIRRAIAAEVDGLCAAVLGDEPAALARLELLVDGMAGMGAAPHDPQVSPSSTALAEAGAWAELLVTVWGDAAARRSLRDLPTPGGPVTPAQALVRTLVASSHTASWRHVLPALPVLAQAPATERARTSALLVRADAAVDGDVLAALRTITATHAPTCVDSARAAVRLAPDEGRAPAMEQLLTHAPADLRVLHVGRELARTGAERDVLLRMARSLLTAGPIAAQVILETGDHDDRSVAVDALHAAAGERGGRGAYGAWDAEDRRAGLRLALLRRDALALLDAPRRQDVVRAVVETCAEPDLLRRALDVCDDTTRADVWAAAVALARQDEPLLRHVVRRARSEQERADVVAALTACSPRSVWAASALHRTAAPGSTAQAAAVAALRGLAGDDVDAALALLRLEDDTVRTVGLVEQVRTRALADVATAHRLARSAADRELVGLAGSGTEELQDLLRRHVATDTDAMVGLALLATSPAHRDEVRGHLRALHAADPAAHAHRVLLRLPETVIHDVVDDDTRAYAVRMLRTNAERRPGFAIVHGRWAEAGLHDGVGTARDLLRRFAATDISSALGLAALARTTQARTEAIELLVEHLAAGTRADDVAGGLARLGVLDLPADVRDEMVAALVASENPDRRAELPLLLALPLPATARTAVLDAITASADDVASCSLAAARLGDTSHRVVEALWRFAATDREVARHLAAQPDDATRVRLEGLAPTALQPALALALAEPEVAAREELLRPWVGEPEADLLLALAAQDTATARRLLLTAPHRCVPVAAACLERGAAPALRRGLAGAVGRRVGDDVRVALRRRMRLDPRSVVVAWAAPQHADHEVSALLAHAPYDRTCRDLAMAMSGDLMTRRRLYRALAAAPRALSGAELVDVARRGRRHLTLADRRSIAAAAARQDGTTALVVDGLLGEPLTPAELDRLAGLAPTDDAALQVVTEHGVDGTARERLLAALADRTDLPVLAFRASSGERDDTVWRELARRGRTDPGASLAAVPLAQTPRMRAGLLERLRPYVAADVDVAAAAYRLADRDERAALVPVLVDLVGRVPEAVLVLTEQADRTLRAALTEALLARAGRPATPATTAPADGPGDGPGEVGGTAAPSATGPVRAGDVEAGAVLLRLARRPWADRSLVARALTVPVLDSDVEARSHVLALRSRTADPRRVRPGDADGTPGLPVDGSVVDVGLTAAALLDEAFDADALAAALAGHPRLVTAVVRRAADLATGRVERRPGVGRLLLCLAPVASQTAAAGALATLTMPTPGNGSRDLRQAVLALALRTRDRSSCSPALAGLAGPEDLAGLPLPVVEALYLAASTGSFRRPPSWWREAGEPVCVDLLVDGGTRDPAVLARLAAIRPLEARRVGFLVRSARRLEAAQALCDGPGRVGRAARETLRVNLSRGSAVEQVERASLLLRGRDDDHRTAAHEHLTALAAAGDVAAFAVVYGRAARTSDTVACERLEGTPTLPVFLVGAPVPRGRRDAVADALERRADTDVVAAATLLLRAGDEDRGRAAVRRHLHDDPLGTLVALAALHPLPHQVRWLLAEPGVGAGLVGYLRRVGEDDDRLSVLAAVLTGRGELRADPPPGLRATPRSGEAAAALVLGGVLPDPHTEAALRRADEAASDLAVLGAVVLAADLCVAGRPVGAQQLVRSAAWRIAVHEPAAGAALAVLVRHGAITARDEDGADELLRAHAGDPAIEVERWARGLREADDALVDAARWAPSWARRLAEAALVRRDALACLRLLRDDSHGWLDATFVEELVSCAASDAARDVVTDLVDCVAAHPAVGPAAWATATLAADDDPDLVRLGQVLDRMAPAVMATALHRVLDGGVEGRVVRRLAPLGSTRRERVVDVLRQDGRPLALRLAAELLEEYREDARGALARQLAAQAAEAPGGDGYAALLSLQWESRHGSRVRATQARGAAIRSAHGDDHVLLRLVAAHRRPERRRGWAPADWGRVQALVRRAGPSSSADLLQAAALLGDVRAVETLVARLDVDHPGEHAGREAVAAAAALARLPLTELLPAERLEELCVSAARVATGDAAAAARLAAAAWLAGRAGAEAVRAAAWAHRRADVWCVLAVLPARRPWTALTVDQQDALRHWVARRRVAAERLLAIADDETSHALAREAVAAHMAADPSGSALSLVETGTPVETLVALAEANGRPRAVLGTLVRLLTRVAPGSLAPQARATLAVWAHRLAVVHSRATADRLGPALWAIAVDHPTARVAVELLHSASGPSERAAAARTAEPFLRPPSSSAVLDAWLAAGHALSAEQAEAALAGLTERAATDAGVAVSLVAAATGPDRTDALATALALATRDPRVAPRLLAGLTERERPAAEAALVAAASADAALAGVLLPVLPWAADTLVPALRADATDSWAALRALLLHDVGGVAPLDDLLELRCDDVPEARVWRSWRVWCRTGRTLPVPSAPGAVAGVVRAVLAVPAATPERRWSWMSGLPGLGGLMTELAPWAAADDTAAEVLAVAATEDAAWAPAARSALRPRALHDRWAACALATLPGDARELTEATALLARWGDDADAVVARARVVVRQGGRPSGVLADRLRSVLDDHSTPPATWVAAADVAVTAGIQDVDLERLGRAAAADPRALRVAVRLADTALASAFEDVALGHLDDPGSDVPTLAQSLDPSVCTPDLRARMTSALLDTPPHRTRWLQLLRWSHPAERRTRWRELVTAAAEDAGLAAAAVAAARGDLERSQAWHVAVSWARADAGVVAALAGACRDEAEVDAVRRLLELHLDHDTPGVLDLLLPAVEAAVLLRLFRPGDPALVHVLQRLDADAQHDLTAADQLVAVTVRRAPHLATQAWAALEDLAPTTREGTLTFARRAADVGPSDVRHRALEMVRRHPAATHPDFVAVHERLLRAVDEPLPAVREHRVDDLDLVGRVLTRPDAFRGSDVSDVSATLERMSAERPEAAVAWLLVAHGRLAEAAGRQVSLHARTLSTRAAVHRAVLAAGVAPRTLVDLLDLEPIDLLELENAAAREIRVHRRDDLVELRALLAARRVAGPLRGVPADRSRSDSRTALRRSVDQSADAAVALAALAETAAQRREAVSLLERHALSGDRAAALALLEWRGVEVHDETRQLVEHLLPASDHEGLAATVVGGSPAGRARACAALLADPSTPGPVLLRLLGQVPAPDQPGLLTRVLAACAHDPGGLVDVAAALRASAAGPHVLSLLLPHLNATTPGDVLAGAARHLLAALSDDVHAAMRPVFSMMVVQAASGRPDACARVLLAVGEGLGPDDRAALAAGLTPVDPATSSVEVLRAAVQAGVADASSTLAARARTDVRALDACLGLPSLVNHPHVRRALTERLDDPVCAVALVQADPDHADAGAAVLHLVEADLSRTVWELVRQGAPVDVVLRVVPRPTLRTAVLPSLRFLAHGVAGAAVLEVELATALGAVDREMLHRLQGHGGGSERATAAGRAGLEWLATREREAELPGPRRSTQPGRVPSR